MEQRRGEDLREDFKRVERGWCLGNEQFRRELLEHATKLPLTSHHYGEAARETDLAKAELLVQEGLKRRGWTDADLTKRCKGDKKKVALALQLRANTTMPLSWIAARLGMGTRGYLTWLVYRAQPRPSAAI